MLMRISIPADNVQKSIKLEPAETVWAAKLLVLDRFNYRLSGASEPNTSPNMREVQKTSGASAGGKGNHYLNFGLYIPPHNGKEGKFMEEWRSLESYRLEENALLEFKVKHRSYPPSITQDVVKKINVKKNQKSFAEYVQKGQVEKVKKDLDKGMDPNIQLENGDTPMSLAVMNDDEDMIETLIQGGAFLDFRTADGRTPMHLAAAQMKPKALRVLLNYGGWPNCRDADNLTPLYLASVHGATECIRKLLQSRVIMDVTDNNGRTELHQSCSNGHSEITLLLVDFGANMNAQNDAGNTPLHVCASKHSVDCCKRLLTRGAARNIQNKAGHTALQVAVMSNHMDIAELIKNFTADQIVPPPPKPSEEDSKVRYTNSLSRTSSASSMAQGHFTTNTINRHGSTASIASDMTNGNGSPVRMTSGSGLSGIDEQLGQPTVITSSHSFSAGQISPNPPSAPAILGNAMQAAANSLRPRSSSSQENTLRPSPLGQNSFVVPSPLGQSSFIVPPPPPPTTLAPMLGSPGAPAGAHGIPAAIVNNMAGMNISIPPPPPLPKDFVIPPPPPFAGNISPMHSGTLPKNFAFPGNLPPPPPPTGLAPIPNLPAGLDSLPPPPPPF